MLQPAVRGQRRGRRRRVAVIALHHLRPAHPELARLPRARSPRRSRDRPAGIRCSATGAPTIPAGSPRRGDVADRAHLGHPVALDHLAADARRAGRRQLRPERRRAREHEVERRQVELARPADAWRAPAPPAAPRRAAASDAPRSAAAPPRSRSAAASPAPRRSRGRGSSAPSCRRCGNTAGRPASRRPADAERRPRLQHVRHQVAMRQHHALGQPRRPRRIGHHHHAAAPDRPAPAPRAAPPSARRARRPLSRADHRDLADAVPAAPARASQAAPAPSPGARRRSRGADGALRPPYRLGLSVVTVPPAQATPWKATDPVRLVGRHDRRPHAPPRARAREPARQPLDPVAERRRRSAARPVGPSISAGAFSRPRGRRRRAR